MGYDSEITPEFRVAWPNVFELKENVIEGKSNGKKECWVTCLFKKGEDLTRLKKLAMAAGKEHFGENTKKWPKFKNATFRDQKEMAKQDPETQEMGPLPAGCEEGAFFIRLKSRQLPGIVDQKRRPIIDAEKFYSGCWARAEVTAVGYSNLGNHGISFWMNNLQLVRDDEPLTGRRRAEDVFEAIEVEEEEDVLGGSGNADMDALF